MTSFVPQLCRAAFLVLCLAPPLSAQQIGQMVSSDLNGDQRVERFTLLDSGEGTVDLQIENTGGGVIYAEDIAWLGGVGQQPELTLAPNGSVKLTSMNEAIGRNRWHMTLTIAYRKGAYRVAGFTYDWYDTLDLNDYGLCDLNLLNGRGVAENGGNRRNVRTDQPAIPVTQWNDSIPIPKVCGLSY